MSDDFVSYSDFKLLVNSKPDKLTITELRIIEIYWRNLSTNVLISRLESLRGHTWADGKVEMCEKEIIRKIIIERSRASLSESESHICCSIQ